MKAYAFHREADEEFLETLRYYAAIHNDLGRQFYDEMEKLINEVCSDPPRFRMIRPPVRRHLSQVFPYALLFVDRPDEVIILSVMHCSREPGYWARRLT